MPEQHDQDREREPLVKVAVAANDFDAQLMHDELTAAGIRSMVRGQDVLASTLDVGVAAPFSREILVLQGDAARARDVLGDRAQD
ncbi:MAG: hypothetical protein ACRDJE_23560 [Dehalococcoidia bacterium]